MGIDCGERISSYRWHCSGNCSQKCRLTSIGETNLEHRIIITVVMEKCDNCLNINLDLKLYPRFCKTDL